MAPSGMKITPLNTTADRPSDCASVAVIRSRMKSQAPTQTAARAHVFHHLVLDLNITLSIILHDCRRILLEPGSISSRIGNGGSHCVPVM